MFGWPISELTFMSRVGLQQKVHRARPFADPDAAARKIVEIATGAYKSNRYARLRLPVDRTTETSTEIAMMCWGMPPPPRIGGASVMNVWNASSLH
jgi:hypothetical protein